MSLVPIMTRKGFASGNPGDVFIGLGLQYLMESHYGPLQWYYLDKFSSEDFEQSRWVLEQAKYLIYAGTPQYNNYDDWMFWYDWPVWKDFIIPMGLKFHTVAGGSGFPDPLMSPQAFSDHCRSSEKTRSILRSRGIRTGLSTVRDPHSYQLVVDSGFETNLLPCSATWSSQYLGVTRGIPERALLVPPSPEAILPSLLGVDTTEEVSRIVLSQWGELFKALKHEQPLFVCHSQSEYKLFSAAGYPAYFTNDVLALMRVFATGKRMVSSRLHACLPAHGLGIESIVSVPIDTRGAAVELCGIPQVPHSQFSVGDILEGLKIENPPALMDAQTEYHRLFAKHLSI